MLEIYLKPKASEEYKKLKLKKGIQNRAVKFLEKPKLKPIFI